MMTDSDLGEELLKDQTDQGQYFIDDDGYLCRWKQTKDGFTPVRISNFEAHIVDEISEDDGIEVKTFYGIEGKIGDRVLPRVEIAASQFSGMNWTPKWGSQCIIEPGLSNKDYLRHSIQTRSNGIKRQTYYTHTGLRKINGQWAYLTASGAIGAENVSVRLPKELDWISVPAIPENETEAIKVSLSFLTIGPKHITLPIYVFTFLAPVTSILNPMPNFSQYQHGPTGVLKTTISELALSHYGDTNGRPLSNFEDSPNSIEKRSFTLKDIPHLVDDYCPSYRKIDAQQKEHTAQRIIRAYSNRTGRHRLFSDTTERGSYPPRGILNVTGEELPALQSTNARLSVNEISQGDIDKAKLTLVQQRSGLLPHAMSSYINWLLPQLDDIKLNFPDHFRRLRDKAFKEGQHAKLPEQTAFYQYSWETVLNWLTDKRIVSEKQAQKMSHDGWTVFNELAEKQAKRIDREDPVRRFKEVVQTLITQERVKLSHKDFPGDILGNEKAELLGYYDELHMYFLPTALWNSLQRYCISEGSHFPFSKQTFYRMLTSRRLIEPGKDSTTKEEWIEGKTKRVLKIARAFFDDDEAKKEKP